MEKYNDTVVIDENTYIEEYYQKIWKKIADPMISITLMKILEM